ncbi:PREDICTED: putative methyltransferase At1g22800 [Nicotiana attenuata]|uniref:putative methyltransferase At1g22800 n=1 Tax=Nicotiana attenuata TaxID=49451 RepID=UPI000904FE86|nr:PREDICTED: putative methyltransferase At1g22800 [Nicotiana attenuata]
MIDDVVKSMKIGQLKWRSTMGLLYDRKIPDTVKGGKKPSKGDLRFAEKLLKKSSVALTFRPGFLETMGSNPSRGKRLGGIEKLLMMDTSCDMVKLCKDAEQQMPNDNIETSYIIGDEEYLPVKENSVDLVISCLGLHWTNDLPGAMIQCRLALKSDGLFLAAILGGETLKELRIACTVAQMEREGGIRPRLSPLAQVRDAGNLLTRAGFTLPGVDVDEYTVRYSSGKSFASCFGFQTHIQVDWLAGASCTLHESMSEYVLSFNSAA